MPVFHLQLSRNDVLEYCAVNIALTFEIYLLNFPSSNLVRSTPKVNAKSLQKYSTYVDIYVCICVCMYVHSTRTFDNKSTVLQCCHTNHLFFDFPTQLPTIENCAAPHSTSNFTACQVNACFCAGKYVLPFRLCILCFTKLKLHALMRRALLLEGIFRKLSFHSSPKRKSYFLLLCTLPFWFCICVCVC